MKQTSKKWKKAVLDKQMRCDGILKKTFTVLDMMEDIISDELPLC